MAVSVGVVVAKVATAIVTDKKARKVVGWILVIVLAPIILIVISIYMLIFNLQGSGEDTSFIDSVFFSQSLGAGVEEDLAELSVILQDDFKKIDELFDEDSGLDVLEIKSTYYVLALYTNMENEFVASDFIECFTGVDIDKTYENIYNEYGIEVDKSTIEVIDEVYKYVKSIENQDINSNIFTVPDDKNNIDLANYAIQAYENNWGYVWGTFGQVLTPSLYSSKLAQYPDGVGNWSEFILENWLNGRTADCIGLIKSYSWYNVETESINYATNGMPDIGADTMYNNAIEKGTIDTMPEIVGLAVWCNGHIGVYIGNGEIIEAMGTQYGVVKTKVSERNFTHWLKIPYINYIEE